MKKTSKLKVLIACVLLFASFAAVAGAQGVIQNARYNTRQAPGFFGGCTKISCILFAALDILLSVAGIVAVLFIVIGGFRYVVAGPNEEAVESAKKTIFNGLIGVSVIILSFVILRLLENTLLGTV